MQKIGKYVQLMCKNSSPGLSRALMPEVVLNIQKLPQFVIIKKQNNDTGYQKFIETKLWLTSLSALGRGEFN